MQVALHGLRSVTGGNRVVKTGSGKLASVVLTTVERMVRKSFRFGLRLGILLGAAAAVAKTVQGRIAARREPVPEPWTPAAPPEPAPRAEDVSMADAGLTPVSAPAEPEPEPVDPAVLTLRTPDALATVEETPAIGAEPSAPPIGAEPSAPPAEPPAPAEEAPAERPVDEMGEPVVEVPASDTIVPEKRTRRRTASTPAAPAKRAAKKSAGGRAASAPAPWIDPVGGVCPPSHPIKAKLSSKIFHLPGMFAYERTVPDRCYAESDQAVRDGFRQARR